MRGRKADHIRICAEEKISPDHRYWDDIKLIHEALPELDYDDIDTSTVFLGRKLELPFMVTAITGGFPGATRINANLAEACSRMGVGMGVGSQRAALEGIDVESYTVILDYDVPLRVGNLGAPQLIAQPGKDPFTMEDMEQAIEMIDAHVLAIHLNYLQELVQPEGDKRALGCRDCIREAARRLPVMIKETGAGISASTANRLKGIGVRAIDVAGMGGTSFSAVEMYRAADAQDSIRERIGKTFFDWGIPAPASVRMAQVGLPLVASGGIEDGLQAAKAIVLGADLAGMAGTLLKEAMESADAVEARLQEMAEELKVAMMLTGSKDLKQLSRVEPIITGPTRDWMPRDMS